VPFQILQSRKINKYMRQNKEPVTRIVFLRLKYLYLRKEPLRAQTWIRHKPRDLLLLLAVLHHTKSATCIWTKHSFSTSHWSTGKISARYFCAYTRATSVTQLSESNGYRSTQRGSKRRNCCRNAVSGAEKTARHTVNSFAGHKEVQIQGLVRHPAQVAERGLQPLQVIPRQLRTMDVSNQIGRNECDHDNR